MKTFVTQCRDCMCAAVLVTAMITATIIMWYFILIGSNPFQQMEPTRLYDANGVERTQFAPGDWVYVKRQTCLSKSTAVTQSGALFDADRHVLITVTPGFSSAILPTGCTVAGTAFAIPDRLPPGQYDYRVTINFQDNLIGRSQAISLPAVTLRVK
jgi:hypothetical protein